MKDELETMVDIPLSQTTVGDVESVKPGWCAWLCSLIRF